jgi:hypothetical protein
MASIPPKSEYLALGLSASEKSGFLACSFGSSLRHFFFLLGVSSKN